MTVWAGQRISLRGVLLLLGMLVFTGIHLVACAHGPDRAGGDTLAAAPVPSALCQPGGTALRADRDIAHDDGSTDGHHALCGVALDRLPDPRPRLADTSAPPGGPAPLSVPGPTLHAPRSWPGSAGHRCAPAGSRAVTLSLLCVSRT